ncbi:hypothetical protein [Kitasatospora sp. NPDC056181]|uniref:hypothetical protein n=1 Tax=Kitasatospora sp. NPDC056181 TaxID=3345737 RepID=UPI0035E063A5
MHPTKLPEAEALLRAGHSNGSVARQLHVDKSDVARLRDVLGLPAVPAQPLTVEEKWRQRTRPAGGGHLEWTGEHTTAGARVMRHSGRGYSAHRIAFRIRHGQDPAGYAKAGCGRAECVAPDHQVDTADYRVHRTTPAHYASPEAKLAALTEPAADGHVRWTGPMNGRHPLLKHGGRRWPVLTLAFRQHYGRDPIGTVMPGCDLPDCVAGAHLDDNPARARLRTALAALGL